MRNFCTPVRWSIGRKGWRPGLLAGIAALGLIGGRSPQGGTLAISPTFDTTITTAPNAAQIEAAINTAITTIDGLYSTFNTVTDNVYFELGPGSFLARTNTGFFGESYASYTNALEADSAANPGNAVLSTAIANLSKGNDSNGASRIAATTGLLRMLGFTAPPCYSSTGDFSCGAAGHPFDAIVTLSTTQPLDYTRPTPAFPPTEYDALGAIEHELDEVAGGGGAGSTLNEILNNCSTNPSNFFCNKFGTLDLYRYSAPDAPSFTTSGSASSYFSIDGGVTNIVGFNQNSRGDFADFGPNVTPCPGGGFGGPDAFIQDAFNCNNQQREDYTTASPEYDMMLAIGYDPALAVVSEPSTLAILSVALFGLGFLSRNRTKGRVAVGLRDIGLPADRAHRDAKRKIADKAGDASGPDATSEAAGTRKQVEAVNVITTLASASCPGLVASVLIGRRDRFR